MTSLGIGLSRVDRQGMNYQHGDLIGGSDNQTE